MTDRAIETFMRNGLRVSIHHDEDPESPRTYDNLATLACWHRRYTLGDLQPKESSVDFVIPEDALAVLPLHLFEHGGITMSTGAYGDRFDSGQAGWAYVTPDRASVMGCEGEGWTRERYEEAIRDEVRTYANYLEGRNCGYVIESPDGETLTSCWGFTGEENMDYVRSEAIAAADAEENPEVAALCARATFAGPMNAENPNA